MSAHHKHNHKEKNHDHHETASEGTIPVNGVHQDEQPPKKQVMIAEEELQALQTKVRECEEMKETLLRKAADFENAKKRLVREKDDFVKYAAEKLMQSFLPVLDNLDHALGHSTHDNAESIMAGVTLIKKQIIDVLKNNGLAPIEAVGAVFDPHIHEAVGTVETDEKPADTVVDEVRCGYMLKDKLLRPSWVRVAQPKMEQPEEPSTESDPSPENTPS